MFSTKLPRGWRSSILLADPDLANAGYLIVRVRKKGGKSEFFMAYAAAAPAHAPHPLDQTVVIANSLAHLRSFEVLSERAKILDRWVEAGRPKTLPDAPIHEVMVDGYPVRFRQYRLTSSVWLAVSQEPVDGAYISIYGKARVRLDELVLVAG
jgi:hypothetical protein